MVAITTATHQVNALAGLTRKFTPNFLVGVLGGYERFDYSSQAFNGVLKGDGWTAGTYLGWRLTPNVRFGDKQQKAPVSGAFFRVCYRFATQMPDR